MQRRKVILVFPLRPSKLHLLVESNIFNAKVQRCKGAIFFVFPLRPLHLCAFALVFGCGGRPHYGKLSVSVRIVTRFYQN